MSEKKIRIAAVSDIHVRTTSVGEYNELFADMSEKADIILLCGDLTDKGLAAEAEVLVRELYACKIPILVVLGNHDFESDQQEEITKVLTQSKINVLDGDFFVYKGVGFAGCKGFCGGFGKYMLPSWGEHINKQFVYETINETVKLENALDKLETEHKVVLLHYSPIKETVSNEVTEILPFLGSSRLAEPLIRIGASAVFHGHAHLGPMEGKTLNNIPVYNVAYALMKQHNAHQPYRIFEL